MRRLLLVQPQVQRQTPLYRQISRGLGPVRLSSARRMHTSSGRGARASLHGKSVLGGGAGVLIVGCLVLSGGFLCAHAEPAAAGEKGPNADGLTSMKTSPHPRTNGIPFYETAREVDSSIFERRALSLLYPHIVHKHLVKHQNTTTVNASDHPVSEVHVNTFPANPSIEDTYALWMYSKSSKAAAASVTLPGQADALFGVFDGHTGGSASAYCKEHLLPYIMDFHTLKSKDNPDRPLLTEEPFLRADEHFLEWAAKAEDFSGACFNVLHLKGNVARNANGGDCRAVLGRTLTNKRTGETKWEAIAMSKDHELKYNEQERERLLKEHPNESDVLYRNRIKGHLQPTRGFGDGTYKDIRFYHLRPRYMKKHGDNWHPPYSTARPEMSERELLLDPTPLRSDSEWIAQDKFIVMASDGLYEDLNNKQVVNIVARYMNDTQSLSSSSSSSSSSTSSATSSSPARMNAATYLLSEALVAAAKDRYGSPPAELHQVLMSNSNMDPNKKLSLEFNNFNTLSPPPLTTTTAAGLGGLPSSIGVGGLMNSSMNFSTVSTSAANSTTANSSNSSSNNNTQDAYALHTNPIMSLQHRYYLSRLLTAQPRERRRIHDDVTAIVVFLSENERKSKL